MKFTVECKEIYDSMGFALLTISLAMEYYRKGLELCGGGAPVWPLPLQSLCSLGLGLTRTSGAGHIKRSFRRRGKSAPPLSQSKPDRRDAYKRQPIFMNCLIPFQSWRAAQ
jgi:hypothetical protein